MADVFHQKWRKCVTQKGGSGKMVEVHHSKWASTQAVKKGGKTRKRAKIHSRIFLMGVVWNYSLFAPNFWDYANAKYVSRSELNQGKNNCGLFVKSSFRTASHYRWGGDREWPRCLRQNPSRSEPSSNLLGDRLRRLSDRKEDKTRTNRITKVIKWRFEMIRNCTVETRPRR
jgi:hypothetical protein